MPFTICFDIGGTRIKSGVIAGDKIVQTNLSEVKDNSALQPILVKLERVIDQYLAEHKQTDQLAGIGIALPCFVDSKKNKILSHYVKYTDAAGLDLNQWARNKWGVPIALQNDAKAALLGEAEYGAGKGYRNLVMLTFGTGIGSGVMLDGHLLNGKDYIAGNLAGHSIIDYDGDLCNCGNIGCTEAVASSWSLPHKVQKMWAAEDQQELASVELTSFENIDFKYLFDQAAKGHQFYNKVLEDCLQAWGMALVNMVLAYNPDCIICGGGIMKSHEIIFPYFKKVLDQHGWINSEFVELKKAEQPEYAALLGMNYTITKPI
ncbi:MAG: glucokinase [Saprospiraceae bacterium]|nr:MAG: glucokinase [Saprospiraceae bacterium]